MYLTTTIVAVAVVVVYAQTVQENAKTTGVNWYRLGIEDKMCKAV